MANQKPKSQAQRAAEKKQSNKTGGNQSPKKNAPEEKTSIPARVITSLTCLALFVLFLVMFFWQEGILVEKVLRPFVLGLIGEVAFAIAIPAVLCLFAIQAFSGSRPVISRSVCLIMFVMICGFLHQLVLPQPAYNGFGAMLVTLYQGGSDGTTAGVLCGGISYLIRYVCGPVIPYIVFVVAAVMTLLGSFQITIPSIVRAIQNCPKEDWVDEDPEEIQEPVSVLVNHFANKRIRRKEERTRIKTERKEQAESDEKPEQEVPRALRKQRKRADELMSQIDGEVDKPVAAASNKTLDNSNVDLILEKPKTRVKSGSNVVNIDPVPAQMPVFQTFEEVVPLEPQVKPQEQPVVKPEPKVEKLSAKDTAESAAQVAAEIAEAAAVVKPEYCYPPIDLLKNSGGSVGDGTMEMRENSRRLNETLASFKIEAHITNVTRGPSVTRYEVELDKGVRLNKLTSCADDIALSLGASGVRISAVPGKISIVGIEVPNRAVTTVSLREVIDSNEFNRAKSKSSFAVGKDIGGNCIVGNISKLPHMLIAGTTGSGKSVCMNSVIISLLYKASPEEVKLIMVDPKMVELGIYNGIPHLLIPVVTDPKKAAGSLQWAVAEMMRRYKTMSDAGVRDLESYNAIVDGEEGGKKLPQVVVIIDELADLMLVAAKEVEESICRIAQMGRAAGIHLIIATQRPSADVITGLMKANIPSRIAFAVASAMESRIILDTMGAEKLVGRGDMLYAPIGAGKPLRVQGCFVSDPEVEAVANYVKQNFSSTYDQDVMDEIERKAAQTGSGKPATASDPEPSAAETDGDELLPAAVDVILETGQASVSMLQRRLKLGYARAARIVDEMEEKGIVGPFQGSKPREILVTKEQWATMKAGSSEQMGFDDIGAEEDDFSE